MSSESSRLGANPYTEPDIAHYYASLDEYSGTYRLAVRELPVLIARHVTGKRALDFACGAGRSTRFLKSLGFDAVGIDVSSPMLDQARQRDPHGTYLLMRDGDFKVVAGRTFDLILSAFPLGNATTHSEIIRILSGLRALLTSGGCIVVVEPTIDLYWHEWVSFTTAGFVENRTAKSGDPVSIAFRDLTERPVVDILWTDADYKRAFDAAGLVVVEKRLPLGGDGDQEPWISEQQVAPWVVYVLAQRR